MNRKEELYEVIKSQSQTGLVQVEDSVLMLITNIPRRTIQRYLTELEREDRIKRETIKKRNNNGAMCSVRYIVITDKELPKRGFTIQQHKELAKGRNHKLIQWGINSFEWFRRFDGQWEEIAVLDKEFKTPQHAYEFINDARSKHEHIGNTGDYELLLHKANGSAYCCCKTCKKIRKHNNAKHNGKRR